jgi:hypothetical protein
MEKLESALNPPRLYSTWGCIRQRLPSDYKGEKHLVVIKHNPDLLGCPCVDWAEVEGPAPKSSGSSRDRHLDVVVVGPNIEKDDLWYEHLDRPGVGEPGYVKP